MSFAQITCLITLTHALTFRRPLRSSLCHRLLSVVCYYACIVAKRYVLPENYLNK